MKSSTATDSVSRSSASRRVCIFAGAGSSCALAEFPSQGELISDLLAWDLQGTRHLSDELRRLLDALGDIEIVLSHYQALAYPRPGKRSSKHAQELMFLRVALAAFFDDRHRATTPTRATDLFRHFLDSHKLERRQLMIVTTNYDLVLEMALESIYGRGAFWYPGLSSGSVDAVPIVKLHGSINWFEDRGPAEQSVATRGAKPFVAAISDFELRPRQSAGSWFVRNGRKYSPVLIPPVFGKDLWREQDNAIWTQMFKAVQHAAEVGLKEARAVHFWGYSLPAADYQMLALLLRAVSDEAQVHTVDVNDGRRDTLLQRVAKIIGRRSADCRRGLADHLNALPYCPCSG